MQSKIDRERCCRKYKEKKDRFDLCVVSIQGDISVTIAHDSDIRHCPECGKLLDVIDNNSGKK